jgi:hypothetical protein
MAPKILSSQPPSAPAQAEMPAIVDPDAPQKKTTSVAPPPRVPPTASSMNESTPTGVPEPKTIAPPPPKPRLRHPCDPAAARGHACSERGHTNPHPGQAGGAGRSRKTRGRADSGRRSRHRDPRQTSGRSRTGRSHSGQTGCHAGGSCRRHAGQAPRHSDARRAQRRQAGRRSARGRYSGQAFFHDSRSANARP